MANRLCADIGHYWLASASAGWCFCDRPRCRAVGVCPACFGYRIAGIPSAFCTAHQAYTPYEGEYIELDMTVSLPPPGECSGYPPGTM